MWTASFSPEKGPGNLSHGIFAIAMSAAVMILFAASARPISIPAAKARAEALSRSAASTKTAPPLVGQADAELNLNMGITQAPELAGKRDPFRLPPPPPPPGAVPKAVSKPSGPRIDLPPGPGGLLIDQLRLQGIVAENATHRMIAIVTSDTNRAYFLRLNEPVFDGVVTQITPDAIHFRQRLQGAHGSVSFREVVKRLSPRKSQ